MREESFDFLDHQLLVEAANELPPLPNTVSELMRIFSDPNYPVLDVVKVVELDSALTGMLLRLANAAAYGSKATNSAKTAIMRVGAGMVQAIAIASSVKPRHKFDLSLYQMTIQDYWTHSVLTLAFAEELSARKLAEFPDDFQTGAVLHDFGKLLICDQVPKAQQSLLQSLSPDMPFHQRETTILSVNHAEVSAVVAQHWGLSEELVRAIQYHHQPSIANDALAHGLALSNHLAWRLENDPHGHFETEAESRVASMQYFELSPTSLESIYQSGFEKSELLIELLR